MVKNKPEVPAKPEAQEVLEERVAHGAAEIADSIGSAEPEQRSHLLHVAADALEKQGIFAKDIHDAQKSVDDFNPDSLQGIAGKHSGRTRAQLLAGRSIARPRPIQYGANPDFYTEESTD